jgi:hypothetical protein
MQDEDCGMSLHTVLFSVLRSIALIIRQIVCAKLHKIYCHRAL